MIKKIQKYLRKHWIFVVILVAGIFLRAYKPYEWFMYSHDQDLAAWIIKDIVKDGHIRLIGQETTSKGVFIGPIFYYLQIPFYFLTGWDPAGSVWLSVVLSVFSIWSFYFVLSKMFGKTAGVVTAVIYSFSYLIIFIEREVAPTMPVMFWTVWFLYAMWLLLKGNQKSYLIFGILGGVIWSLNLALALLSPLVLLAQIFSKKKINFKYLFFGLVTFIVLMLPFIVFEQRHNYQQIKALTSSFTTQKDYTEGTGTGVKKVDRVMQLVRKNANNMFLDSVINVDPKHTFIVLVGLFVGLILKKRITLSFAVLLSVWQVLFVMFFTFNSINVSEYYLNGMNVVWLMVVVLSLDYVYEKSKPMALILLGMFIAINMYAFFTRTTNESGYLQRKAIVEYIKKDSMEHGYPCVAVSYITTPGNNFGYRYLFYIAGLHVNQPKSLSPVYTIVFPHSMVDRMDKTFGALGLVLPDYERYNEQEIKESCEGPDANLTESMFGFTK
jgi:4-amino-4-deoxy-L-arabinose transferase-like glycosyltransferase